jgi:hypothetical protein
MSGSQQSGKLSCECKRLFVRTGVIPAETSAAFAEAEDQVVTGMAEKTLGETQFLVTALLDGRFPSGIFCDREIDRQRGTSDGGIGRLWSGTDAAVAPPHSAG